MDEVHLIRDVLDNQIKDREKCPMGKADGIVFVLRKGKPPRLAYLEVGMGTLAHRISKRLGKFAESVGRRWGVRGGLPFRIPWAKVRDVGIDVEVDLDASETPVMDWEKWLKERVISRIPGGG